MQIQQEEQNGDGEFFIEENNEQVALLTYTMKAENLLVINHTEVDKKLQGKNVGFALVERAVEYARTNNLKIKPACSFAIRVFVNEPSFNDVRWQG